MKEELYQIVKNEIWELFPRLKDKNVIGTKWAFRNKMNEQGEVVINKERLVYQVYSKKEGIDYEETFSPIASIKAVIMLLKLMKDQLHSSQESPACKHLSKKERRNRYRG